MQDTDGVIWAVMQSDRYYVPKHVVYFSDGYRMATDDDGAVAGYLSSHSGVTISFEKHYPTKLGIYTMLWKQGGPVDGWAFIAEHNTGRQGLPWFGNAAGTQFVNPLGDILSVDGTYSQHANQASGTYTVSIEPPGPGTGATICGSGKFAAAFSDRQFFEHALDAVVNGSVQLSFLAQSYRSYADDKIKTYPGPYRDIYDPDDPAAQPVALWFQMTPYTTVLATVGQPFISGAAGGQGGYQYSYSGFTVGGDGLISSVSVCGLGAVTVTDACGDSISRDVRMPSGVWVEAASSCYFSDCMVPADSWAVEILNGVSREVWMVNQRCHWERWENEPYYYPDYSSAINEGLGHLPGFDNPECFGYLYPSGVSRKYLGHTITFTSKITTYAWVCP